ncbi:MAG: DMT family transporter [Blautia sp.]|nr:DMT family transporter [Blautia sp.]
MNNVNPTTTKQKKALGTACMLAASVCFSTGGLLIKLIPWNPLAINGARNLVACCVIGLYILLTRHRLKWNLTVCAGAISMAGVTTLFAIANKLTTAGNTIILQYTAPIWIILLMFLFFGKKPDKLEVTAILFVLTGILFFFFESLSTGKILGDSLALLSGVFYAGVFMLNQFEKGDALSSIFFGQLACAVFLGPLVLKETSFGPEVLLPVFILGAVQVGLAYIFFNTGTKYTDPVTASIINALEPILNPILAAVFYGEKLGRLSVIGATIVISGILYYNIGMVLGPRRYAE